MFQPLFHQEIRRRREKLGFLQKDLAEKSGLSRSRLAQIELGLRVPSPKEVAAIAMALSLKAYQMAKWTFKPRNYLRELLKNGECVGVPHFPGQDRPNIIRFNPARRDFRAEADKLTEFYAKRPDKEVVNFFCDQIASESSGEALYLGYLVAAGGVPCLTIPVMKGFLPTPVVHPCERDFVGNRPFPALRTDESFWFFQVSFSTPRIYRVDALRWDQQGWTAVEIDGSGHNFQGDPEKEKAIQLPFERYSESEVRRMIAQL